MIIDNDVLVTLLEHAERSQHFQNGICRMCLARGPKHNSNCKLAIAIHKAKLVLRAKRETKEVTDNATHEASSGD